MYGDRVTNAMEKTLSETERRRSIQSAYNEKHGIVPETIKRSLASLDPSQGGADYGALPGLATKGGKAGAAPRSQSHE